MSQKSRFGKYGDLKRKEKIRQNRIVQAGHRSNAHMPERSAPTDASKPGGHKK
ncbi:hypothetical protein [Desulforhabdus sp. TSK]|uniref:hypothetical protein n=1 Tax=Desulforhabdus sp. TSK TaxID=2925014 RepID=UPI001FC7D5C1|nr:hypothetical protein [Desulforhabdus sp. TSK]